MEEDLEILKTYIVDQVQDKYFNSGAMGTESITKSFIFSEESINEFLQLSDFFDDDERYSWCIEDLDSQDLIELGVDKSYKRLLVSFSEYIK